MVVTPAANPAPLRIGGLSTAAFTRNELARRMASDALAARQTGSDWLPRLVFSSNGQGISLAASDKRFADAMAQADIIHADGMSVVMASRLLTRHPLPERIATTDFFHDAAAVAQSSGLRFFFLGGRESQNAAAYAAVKQSYPQLELAGRHHGYFEPNDEDAICEMIRASRTDVLWLALGKPRQEYWAVRNRCRLGGVGWIKTCGGLFAFLAGEVSRAPTWMHDAGLEWLYRMFQEPSRLGLRYLTSNPHAIWRMLVDSGPPRRTA